MELKPCPFCGSPQIYVTHTRYYDNEDTVCMFCNTCKQVVFLENNEGEGINETTKAAAVEAWNNRAERNCELSRGTRGLVHVGTGHCSECGAETVKDIVAKKKTARTNKLRTLAHVCARKHGRIVLQGKVARSANIGLRMPRRVQLLTAAVHG